MNSRTNSLAWPLQDMDVVWVVLMHPLMVLIHPLLVLIRGIEGGALASTTGATTTGADTWN